jgi:Flp pilus assembly protein protease CpaA
MLEVIFLIILGFIWITFAVVQDLRKREIANWLNFSLVIFALVFRFFYCLFNNQEYGFFFQGVLGFGIFLIIGNLLYYGRVFAGGDAKLMIALGGVLPLSGNFLLNINSVLIFLLFFLVAGAFYGVALSTILAVKNRKRFVKEFSKEFRDKKNYFYISLIFGIILIMLAFFQGFFVYLGILVFIAPYAYFSAKSIDEACMIKKIDTNSLTEGDWLYKDLKIGRRLIKAKWSGLSNEEIDFIRKKKKNILIRQGIPFSPVFLISYAGLICALITQRFYFI